MAVKLLFSCCLVLTIASGVKQALASKARSISNHHHSERKSALENVRRAQIESSGGTYMTRRGDSRDAADIDDPKKLCKEAFKCLEKLLGKDPDMDEIFEVCPQLKVGNGHGNSYYGQAINNAQDPTCLTPQSDDFKCQKIADCLPDTRSRAWNDFSGMEAYYKTVCNCGLTCDSWKTSNSNWCARYALVEETDDANASTMESEWISKRGAANTGTADAALDDSLEGKCA